MKTGFPSQKKKFTQKGKAWREQHLKWVEEIILTKDSNIRTNLSKKIRNYNSYAGKIKMSEYKSILNPNDLEGFYVPEDIQHYPIVVPYLNVLVGEEFDRRFDFRAIVTNPNSISRIEEQKRDMLRNKIAELTENQELSEEEAAEQLKNFLNYLNFEYQDVKEKQANAVLKHFIKELDLKLKFNQGFKDVLICCEEGYIADIINNNPVIEKLDPKKVFVLRSGNSNRYEDADMIVIYDYISPGQAQDQYYSYLKPNEVKWLDSETNESFNSLDGSDLERDEHGLNILRNGMIEDMLTIADISQSEQNIIRTAEIVDEYGNIRRIRLYWKSKKCILKVKYYDADGNPQIRYEAENYVADKTLGEETEEYWVSQWWEGCQLAKDIYPYIRPRQIQYNKFSDPGYNHPGIVGQIYNTGGMKPVSVMDRAMPFMLLYDATMRRITESMSKFFGSIPVVDYASLPEGWDISKWLYFARKAGIAVKNSFKEGNKGASMGKLAGGISGQENVLNQSGIGDYIQQQINILSYIEQQMARIVGIPPQRLGEVQNRETVGGVERSVTQSSFITNEWYKIHDNVKKRVLTLLLETCKISYKDNPVKFQYISDDFANQTFEFDAEMIEEEFGILIDNDTDLTKLEQQLETIVQAGLQNQMLKFSDVMKIYNSSSLSEKQRIIEKSEDDLYKRQEAQRKQEQEAQVQMQQQQLALQEELDARQEKRHQEQLALDKYKIDQDNLTKRASLESSMLDGTTELDAEKLDLEYKKHEEELLLKMKDLEEKIRNNKEKEKLESKKIDKMAAKAKTAAK